MVPIGFGRLLGATHPTVTIEILSEAAIPGSSLFYAVGLLLREWPSRTTELSALQVRHRPKKSTTMFLGNVFPIHRGLYNGVGFNSPVESACDVDMEEAGLTVWESETG